MGEISSLAKEDEVSSYNTESGMRSKHGKA